MKDFFSQFEQHRSRLFGLVRYMTESRQDTEDLIQDIALAGNRRYAGYRGGDFWSWLVMVARSEMTTYFQREKRRRRYECHFEDANEEDREGDRYTEQGFAVAEDRAIIEQVRMIGGPKIFDILDLRLNEDLEYQEIGERLNLSMECVKTRVGKTYRKARGIIEGVAA